MQQQDIDISVIIPCYNDGLYIQEAIASVLAQTYTRYEIIVINDGSDDDFTGAKLAELEHEVTHLICLKNNSGPSVARNLAIRKAQGKYILPLDADDRINPTYLEKGIAILESHMNVGIVYCDAEFFGEMSGKWILPVHSLENFLTNNTIFSTAMFRRDDWQKVGGYNDNMKYGLEDYDFWMSLIERGVEVHKIEETLFYYRQKNVSRTRMLSNHDNELKMFVQLFNNHIDFYTENIELVIRKQREIMAYEPFIRLRCMKYVCGAFTKIYSYKNHIKGLILQFLKK